VLCKMVGVQNVAFKDLKKKGEKKEAPKPVEPEETFSILCRLVGVENVGFAPGVKKEADEKKEGEEGKEATDTKPEEAEKEKDKKEENKEEKKEGKEELDKSAEKKKEEDTPPKPSWKDIAAAAPEVKESPQLVIISAKKSETEKKQVKSEETTEAKTPVVLSGDYKARYYTNRFKDVSLEADFKQRIGTHYLNALHWILRYYFHPIPSWEFYFPYYAAPLASDIDVSAYDPPVFNLGTPWKPFESLIAILPPVSAELLPSGLSSLITDPESPLKEFFPDTVDILQHHKNIEWKAIACLPFVKRDSVTAAIQSRLSSLSAEELKRNSFGGANVLKYDSNEVCLSF
jgi:5'-3' exonuclease